MKEKDRIIIDYLNDILNSIVNIKSFLKDIDYPTFQEDIKTQFAVIRALEIIGEASKKIPKEVKENYFWIPWRFMTIIVVPDDLFSDSSYPVRTLLELYLSKQFQFNVQTRLDLI